MSKFYSDRMFFCLDNADFRLFRSLDTTAARLLVSVPLGPLWQQVQGSAQWERFGVGVAQFLSNASVHGLEIRVAPSLSLNEDMLAMVHVACTEMKYSDHELLFVFRTRYESILAKNGVMQQSVSCPDLVIFRTEHHELKSKVLRAPNPYRRYLGADMAELFLFQELEKISGLRGPVRNQEWCYSMVLGGLLFKYYMGLNFGDDAQSGPQEISLSEICERFSVKRFEDLRTLSFYSMEHTKHTWVGFDDDWSILRKAALVEQREGRPLCVAVFHANLDDHRQACGLGYAPVLHRLRQFINNVSYNSPMVVA
ncbi:uncharacterized protein LOC121045555 [Ixodes scapularis]|uniref:uncharacterized protein LOC121045555 n=1 Tax=Ixodes scapularis TaxID=6945 RepID=UPI001AD79224|nr:uncharacterized protein LOC121045555 [Ixodes scapularis]